MSWSRLNPEIWFIHLVILRVMTDHYDKTGMVALQVQLMGADSLISQWMEENGVSDIRFTEHKYIKGVSTLIAGQAALRRTGLLSTSKEELGDRSRVWQKRQRGNLPTRKGRYLLEQLGSDWRTWPIKIPIVNDRLDMQHAFYLEDIAV